MKYIWTFWTDNWSLDNKWDLLCYAVSIGLAKKFADQTVVYTDKKGGEILEEYKIVCDKEIVDFDIKPATYPKFAEAKLKTMAIQDGPFCHIDHDTFLLSQQKTDKFADIIVQSLETHPNNQLTYKSAANNGNKIDEPEILNLINKNIFYGFNCSYIQSNNPKVCKEWCNDAIAFSKKYDPKSKGDNVIVEQMSLYAYSINRGYKITCLFESDAEINNLGPEMAGYIHLAGAKENIQQRTYATARLINRAKDIAPEFYSRCFGQFSI